MTEMAILSVVIFAVIVVLALAVTWSQILGTSKLGRLIAKELKNNPGDFYINKHGPTRLKLSNYKLDIDINMWPNYHKIYKSDQPWLKPADVRLLYRQCEKYLREKQEEQAQWEEQRIAELLGVDHEA